MGMLSWWLLVRVLTRSREGGRCVTAKGKSPFHLPYNDLTQTNINRLDPHRWFYIYRNALPDTVDNVICPVRLLLTLALRTGNVEYTTVEDIIREARLRPDKTVQWVCKERPVLCAIKRYG